MYTLILYGPSHDILVLIAYTQIPHLNSYADVASGTKGFNFCQSLNLRSYNVYWSREGSGESAQFFRIAEPLLLDSAKRTKISFAGSY